MVTSFIGRQTFIADKHKKHYNWERNHVREEKENLDEFLKEECTKIDVLADEIEDYRKDILELKDKKQCPSCNKEIEVNAVGVRTRKDGDIGQMKVEEFISKIEEEIKNYTR